MQSYLKVHCFLFRDWCIGTCTCGSGTEILGTNDVCYYTEFYPLFTGHWCLPQLPLLWFVVCAYDLYLLLNHTCATHVTEAAGVTGPEQGWQLWEVVAAWAGHEDVSAPQMGSRTETLRVSVWPPYCLCTATNDFTSLTLWNYVLFAAIETIQIIPSTALQKQDMIYWLGEKVLHSICEAASETGK